MEKIELNSLAISFNATDLKGNIINLEDYKGQKLLLSFFRKAACPFCNLGIQQLIKNHHKFEDKGIKIIALFASSKEDVEKYAGKQNPPFPIIPDGDFKIYKQYGIEVSYIRMLKTMANPKKVIKAMFGGFFSSKSMNEDPVIPADFLIDENQRVFRAYYGKDFDDHIPISDILSWKSGKS
ncbi:hypothetical protein BZG02_06830 [Labilibaculum filiforme]|uniref:thioredoxin-dependent peroxiredoxin n=1 Tax=Labilibaculum filiforme TaxID=1940526 RepID=A0A2N3I2J0_9BACT|nr:redoxin domain-containing protein [Labilibaculum filiforme]PKQ64512.1 hypothetical protein BZG02_06830 [Labilibaculum filiforme]